MLPRKNEVTIGQSLSKLLKRGDLGEKYLATKTVVEAKKVFGDFVMERIDEIKCNNGKLYIICQSSAVKQEIYMNKANIIERINDSLGEDHLEDIVLL